MPCLLVLVPLVSLRMEAWVLHPVSDLNQFEEGLQGHGQVLLAKDLMLVVLETLDDDFMDDLVGVG